MTLGFRFTFMISCQLILRHFQRRTTFQLTEYFMKSTRKCKLLDQSQNIGLDSVILSQKIMSYI